MEVSNKILNLKRVYKRDPCKYERACCLSYIILFSQFEENKIPAIESLREEFSGLPRTLWLEKEVIFIEATNDEKFSMFFYVGKAPERYMGRKTNLENQVVDLRVS